MSVERDNLDTYLHESAEGLDQVELDLVALEADPADLERLTRVYRVMHTIKGSAGMLGLEIVSSHAHAGEELLTVLRDERRPLTSEMATLLLRLVDELRQQGTEIERSGTDRDPADGDLLEAFGDLGSAPPPPAVAATGAGRTLGTAARESSVRVDVGVLDTLLGLAGELVLVRGRLEDLTPSANAELLDAHRQLRRASGAMLETIRQARLQPVGAVLRRIPRLARDVAADLGKQVTVELSGAEVGVDRAVNEALNEALLHIVRNAVDHGIETPAERVAAGKPPAGRLRIAASQQGGRVRVEITDDGRGIDVDRVVEHAVAAGRISREVADALDEADQLALVFEPGVSSRATATAVSGRGVGMDAVRAAIARAGGSVEVASVPGARAVFRIDVPLTLSVVACVLVEAGGEWLSLPQTAVTEVVRVEDATASVGGARLLRSRGELIPVVSLAGALGLGADASSESVAVVVEGRGRRVALVVDAVGDPIDAVVKPLPRSVREVRVFGGATVLPDGRPCLIVDPDALVAHLGLRAAEAAVPEAPVAAGPDLTVELLVARGAGRRLAVPAACVWRLERVHRDRLRTGSGLELIDHRDGLLPLVRHDTPDGEGELEVIVCRGEAGLVAFAVDAIEDIFAAELVVAPANGRPGLARLSDGVAELLDVAAAVALEAR